MKLTIPPECQIGARTYKIVWWNSKMQYSADSIAQSDSKHQTIRLPKDWSDIANFVHLIHEIRHAVDWLLNDSSKENITKTESEFIAQAFLSLGIEPDLSQIPEEELTNEQNKG